ncbi:hypothetical protein HJC23_012280 [Cyclotella cryptica]|uniref:Uncharacterized protein n=1 Tax=Cyclotella cryptica TaxID=29204 RepID=A0ABD3NJB6_9STRA
MEQGGPINFTHRPIFLRLSLVSICFVEYVFTISHVAAFVPSTWLAAHRALAARAGISNPFEMSAILESPSAERNKGPIYDTVLSSIVLPRLLRQQEQEQEQQRSSFKVLELAAGCGVHTTHFASSILHSYPQLQLEWHPSDPDREARCSIDARVHRDGLTAVVQNANDWVLGNRGGTACNDGIRDKGDAGVNRDAIPGDSSCYSHRRDYFDLVLCINMIHIAPWEATLGLMQCAGTVLREGGILLCYGPYKVGGTAVESNLKFDESLRSRDPSWGVRDLEAVVQVAKDNGLEFMESVDMPANNMSVLFCKK